MCKKRHFTTNLHYNCEGPASTIFTLCLDEKSTLVHSFTQRVYTPVKINHFNYTSAEKKRRNLIIVLKQVSSTMGDPLTFHGIQKSKHSSSSLSRQLLTFIRRNTRVFAFFPMLTYPQEEKN